MEGEGEGRKKCVCEGGGGVEVTGAEEGQTAQAREEAGDQLA